MAQTKKAREKKKPIMKMKIILEVTKQSKHNWKLTWVMADKSWQQV